MKLLTQKFLVCLQLMRVEKPIGFFLLLWPTLISLWIAFQRKPDIFILSIFVLGTFIMRSAGCVINDICDQNFDGHVMRTKQRPLIKKILTEKEAWFLFIILLLFALILVLQLNRQTLFLSFIAVLITATYPLMKRITHFPQTLLGIAFAWSCPMAFMAVQETIPFTAWLLFLATILWVIAYDTQYALADYTDDLKIGIKSTAIYFGNNSSYFIVFLQFLMLCIFVYLGMQFNANALFYIGILLVGMTFLYQYHLIKDRIPENCLKAFLNNNASGLLLFLSVLAS